MSALVTRLVVTRCQNEDIIVYGDVGEPILLFRFLQKIDKGLASVRLQWAPMATVRVCRGEFDRSFMMRRKPAKGRRTVLGMQDFIEIRLPHNDVRVSLAQLTGMVKSRICIEAPASWRILRGELVVG